MAYGDSKGGMMAKDAMKKPKVKSAPKKKMETVMLKNEKGKKEPVSFVKGGLKKSLGMKEDETIPAGIMDKIIKSKVGDKIKIKTKTVTVTEKMKKQAVLGKNLSKGSRK